MRLLHSRRGIREAGETDAAPPPPAAAAAPEPRHDGDPFAGTQAIGARQERLGADLTEIAQLVGRLQQLSPMIERLRAPLATEFEAYRRDHSELLSVKSHNEALAASVKSLRETEQDLGRQLSDASKVGETAREEVEELRKALTSALSDKGRTQEELSLSAGTVEDLRHALTASEANGRQMEEDVASMRARLTQAADRRRELDAMTARARQEADLAEAENATLRHRVDDLSEQLARLSRSEAQAQAEIGSERERHAGLLAEAERLHREALGQAQGFEGQLVAARAQLANLSTRLDASAARNGKLERLCAELSAKASDAVSHRQNVENAAGDSQTALERALERIDQLERAVVEHKSAHLMLDRARLTALERGDQLAASLHAQETLLARAEERTRLLEESVQTIAVDEENLRRSHEDEAARLVSEVRRLETELQLSQAALKASREHRSFSSAF